MLMLMGSAEALPDAPLEPTKFIEDMTEAELSSAVRDFCNLHVYKFIYDYVDGYCTRTP